MALDAAKSPLVTSACPVDNTNPLLPAQSMDYPLISLLATNMAHDLFQMAFRLQKVIALLNLNDDTATRRFAYASRNDPAIETLRLLIKQQLTKH